MLTRISDIGGIPAGLRSVLRKFLWAVGDTAPTDGATGAGEANIGALYICNATGVAYWNTGTKAAPVWTTATGVVAGILAADATGRSYVADDFFNEATLLAKILTGAATTAALTDAIPADAFTEAFLLKHVLSGAMTSAFLTDAIPDDAITAAIANDIIQNGALGSALLTNPQAYDAGCPMRQVLVASGNVVDNETVLIGADVYEFIVVNTDSTDDTQGGDFANTTDPLELTSFDTNYPNLTGLVVGDLIRAENEILRVTARDAVAETISFSRGASATTAASHANGVSIYTGDTLTAGSTIAVGVVATLTPTVWTAALSADINAEGTELVVASNPSVNEVLIRSAATAGGTVAASATATTTTETMTNAAWGAATMVDGKAAGVRKLSVVVHTVTDDEVTAGAVRLCFPFTVAGFMWQAHDANGLDVTDTYTDQILKSTTFVIFDGTGATNPAAGEIITGVAWD